MSAKDLGESDGAKFSWSLLRQGRLVRQQSENSKLEIARADPSNDYGVYRCVAKDDRGEHLGAAYVAVTIGYDPESRSLRF